MRKDYMDLLNKAISYSIALEDQGTVPRYGWETVDRMIKPSETYDKEKTALLINNAKVVLEIVKKLLVVRIVESSKTKG